MDRFDELHDAAAARLAERLAHHLAPADRDAAPTGADEQAARERAAAPDPASEAEMDAELADLAALGDRLADLGPYLARLAEAEDRLDLTFVARLRREVLAAHPAAHAQSSLQQPAAAAARPARVMTTPSAAAAVADPGAGVAVGPPERAGAADAHGLAVSGRWAGAARALSPRRLLALVTLAAVIALGLLVHALGSSGLRPAYVSTGVPASPQHFARIRDVGGTAGGAGQAPRATAATQPAKHAAGIAPRPAPAPGGASTTAPVAAAPTFSGGGLPQHAALGVAPAASPALRYRLPAALPALPTRAITYTLRYRPLDAQALAALVARFPSLHASSRSAGATVQRTGADGASLRIVPATDELSYQAPSAPLPLTDFAPLAAPARSVRTPTIRRAPAPASPAGATPATASTPSAQRVSTPAPLPTLAAAHRAAYVRSARAWLVDHGLFPVDVALTSLVTALDASHVEVRFLPALPLPLQDGRGAIDLSVDLDPHYRILAAHALWPYVAPGMPHALSSLTARLSHGPSSGVPSSVPGSGAQSLAPSRPISTTVHPNAAPIFAVARVRLVYVAQGLAPAATLQPAYVLEGMLIQPAGGSTSYSQVVPAH